MVRAFDHDAMGRRIDLSWGGPIELFHIPDSAPRLVLQRPWYVQSCLWDGAYKRTFVVNLKVAHVAAAGFLSHYLCGTSPYV